MMVKNRIFIVIFLMCLVFPWIFGGLFYVINPKIYNSLSIVETEKRKMAEIQWGDLLDSGESVSAYIDDRVPFRYTFISAYKALNDRINAGYQIIESALGNIWYEPQEETISADDTVDSEIIDTEEEVISDESAPQVEEEIVDDFFPLHVYEDVIIARDGWLFLYGENEIECYQGTNILSEDQMGQYANKVKQ